MTGRIPASLLFTAILAAAWLTPAAPALAGEEAEEGPACADCHEEETAQWKASSHARAMKPEFIAEWERQGKKFECLACHSTHYDRAAGTYDMAGVGCESCHGPANPDHPDKAKMNLQSGNESCRTCHSITYGEWRLSAHGQKDVGCMSCHSMHAMDLRKEDPDQQCGSCHTSRLEDFAHATHKEKGLHCITCHMPEHPEARNKIKGTGVRGHSYGVGAETCSGCHRVQVHQSGGMASLEHEVEVLKEAGSEGKMKELSTLRQENVDLRQARQEDRGAFPWVAGLCFVLGLGLGLALMGLRRRTPPLPEPAAAA